MANAEKERSAAGAFMRLAELRPRHGALCAFATTLLSCMPVIVVLGGVPRYAALGDSFFLCLLLAAVASGAFLCARALRGAPRDGNRLARGAV